ELVAECCVHFSNFRDNVEIVDAALAEMAVRIEGCANESASADNTAHGLEQLAFAIEAILRHHGAMQSQEHRVKRQRGGDLAEQLITQQPPGPAVDEAAGLGPGGGALDQLPAISAGAGAGRRKDGAAQGGRQRMLSGRGVETVLEVLQVCPGRRESVGLGGERADNRPFGTGCHAWSFCSSAM